MMRNGKKCKRGGGNLAPVKFCVLGLYSHRNGVAVWA